MKSQDTFNGLVLLYSCTSVKVKISLSTIYFLHQTLQRTACNRTSSCNLLHDTNAYFNDYDASLHIIKLYIDDETHIINTLPIYRSRIACRNSRIYYIF